eukprot:TRINITY_DN36415_c0_g1_i1.p1 TRINITY_DN36415_c0_g1~~TRINITY_DN36415_c0_g1_i1.p1  ORF type:complete len:284 (+),score=91.01 TRINITY_DN36415_c0_g1_i1:89-940(+)
MCIRDRWSGGGGGWSSSDDDDDVVEERIDPDAPSPAPSEAKFETLSDGSTALVIPAGVRLKIDLNDLLKGGDEKKQERKLQELKDKKKKWGSYDYGKWYTEHVNEYTITMDIKLEQDPPREGMSLFQTALIHAEDVQSTGKKKLQSSDGECMINSQGGAGVMGQFGDITKARVTAGEWARVVTTVKCVGTGAKGNLKTFVNATKGATLESDTFATNGRFAIDPDTFFLFSSSNPTMIPGVSIRTLRVEAKFSTEAEVLADRARDKILSMYLSLIHISEPTRPY